MRHLRRFLVLPLLIAYQLSGARPLIDADVTRWQRINNRSEQGRAAVLRCLTERTHEFRNLYFHRLSHGGGAGRRVGRLLRLVYRQERTLHLNTRHIGPGLFIQHGFATVVAAERVGANVWINQQVTIGFKVTDGEHLAAPVIEDGATIYAGAKVIGGVRVGRQATVGANAVVVRDVPDGMVAVGVPATNMPAGRSARSRD